jgi:hypothetical protein
MIRSGGQGDPLTPLAPSKVQGHEHSGKPVNSTCRYKYKKLTYHQIPNIS